MTQWHRVNQPLPGNIRRETRLADLI